MGIVSAAPSISCRVKRQACFCWSNIPKPCGCCFNRLIFSIDLDIADVASGQWTLSRTVSALRDSNRGSDLVHLDPRELCARPSVQGWRFPSPRCYLLPRPYYVCPRRGHLPHRRRSSSTACTVPWEAWGSEQPPLDPATTRGTRPSWRKRSRLWFEALLNTHRAMAEVVAVTKIWFIKKKHTVEVMLYSYLSRIFL